MRFALQRKRKRQRKRALMDGGQDPRELQRLSVEARRRRKQQQASGVASSVPHQPDVERALDAASRRRDSSLSDIGSHGRPQLPKTNPTRRTTEDVLAEIDAAYPAKKPPPGPKPVQEFAPSATADVFHNDPRQPGEMASDYFLRHALHQQAEWRRKQQADGVEEVTWPRLVHPDHHPEFY
jgi:hypothetical protein